MTAELENVGFYASPLPTLNEILYLGTFLRRADPTFGEFF